MGRRCGISHQKIPRPEEENAGNDGDIPKLIKKKNKKLKKGKDYVSFLTEN